MTLIIYVCYISHCFATVWIHLGFQSPCTDEAGVELGSEHRCIKSWVYNNDGFDSPEFNQFSKYIFAFYWIFTVITTVGYGDFSGRTNNEYIFSIILEFFGLSFFSFLMGSISGIFSTSDDFESLIESKLDNLDLWIKKIEKSNGQYHI